MSQSLAQLYIHIVFSTKHRKPYLCDKALRDRLYQYLNKKISLSQFIEKIKTLEWDQKEWISKKFIAFSPCFRREAGAHGKDVKGLIRVHEFFKLEQIILCEANHEMSVKFHEEITAHVEHLMQELKLPYRVVANCGGDLGLGQVKKYDIEAWMPSQQKYRETHSSSYFHDFQTRRLNIKYKGEDGKSKYAHSLNNTACATSRLPAAILENYQQADGTVMIPEVLRKYMGGKEFIK